MQDGILVVRSEQFQKSPFGYSSCKRKRFSNPKPAPKKNKTNTPQNRQASVEEISDDDDDHPPCVFPRNPKHILESIEDDDKIGITTNQDMEMADIYVDNEPPPLLAFFKSTPDIEYFNG